MKDSIPYVRSTAVSDISMRLSERLRQQGKAIKSVHVVPSELTGGTGWNATGYDDVDQNCLNEKLGELATNFVQRELTNTLCVNQFDYDKSSGQFSKVEQPFRLGIATGSTIFKLVDSMNQVAAQLKCAFPHWLLALFLKRNIRQDSLPT
ncbi:MAG: DNA-binding transcriptional regulator LsrR (DeoR family) [Pirellulaceae bacterium]|jgi:DNA-binding transcriptional regulator LsrR (DeoR family)